MLSLSPNSSSPEHLQKERNKKADPVYVIEVDDMNHKEWWWGSLSLWIKSGKMVTGTLHVPLAMNPSQWVKVTRRTHSSPSCRLFGTDFPTCSSHRRSDAQCNRNHSSHCHHCHNCLQCHSLFVTQGLEPCQWFVLFLPQLRSAGTIGSAARVWAQAFQVSQLASPIGILCFEGELFVWDSRTCMRIKRRAWLCTDRWIKLLAVSPRRRCNGTSWGRDIRRSWGFFVGGFDRCGHLGPNHPKSV